MLVTMIVLDGLTIEPNANETFIFNEENLLIYVYEDGIPTPVEIINMRKVTSIYTLPRKDAALCICEDTPNPECKAH